MYQQEQEGANTISMVATVSRLRFSWSTGFILILTALLLWTTTVSAEEVSDRDITAAIENELWLDEAIKANNIDVSTIDGIVTFEGTTNNILAKERATAIASSTVGVRSVVNRIEVIPGLGLPDEDLLRLVNQALLENPATDAYEVEATVYQGVVTLTGTVDSWQEKKLCATVAKGVRGVKDIANKIDVSFVLNRSDNEIQAEIDQRLDFDVRVDYGLVAVEVDDGKVTLSGTVGSLTEKHRAVADAWVRGVQSVIAEDLDIRWWARNEMRRQSIGVVKSDEEIREAVRDALLYDPRVNSLNADIAVNDGSVTLTGLVDNLQARLAANEDARNTFGVWRVQNHLKVRPQTPPTDAQLETRVSDALARDPYVSVFDVEVRAESGWITLAGMVNTSFERDMATGITAAVNGVIGVTNNLNFKHLWTWRPDWEIRGNVTDNLQWSPFVDEKQVSVEVKRGVVTLSGNVATWSERLTAEQCAWRGGAKDVRNGLTVTHHYYGPYPFMWPYVTPDRTRTIPPAWAWPPGGN